MIKIEPGEMAGFVESINWDVKNSRNYPEIIVSIRMLPRQKCPRPGELVKIVENAFKEKKEAADQCIEADSNRQKICDYYFDFEKRAWYCDED